MGGLFSGIGSEPVGQTAQRLREGGDPVPPQQTQGPPPLGSLESLDRFQLMVLGGEQEKVDPITRMGLGLLSDRRDKLSFLQAMFPEGDVTDNGDAFAIWRDRPVADAADQRFFENDPVVGKFVTEPDEQGRVFKFQPTIVDPMGFDRGDLAELGPQLLSIAASMAAGFATASPVGAAAVDAALELTMAGLGRTAVPGERFETPGAVLERTALAGLGGGGGQVAANVVTGARQFTRFRNVAARRVAREAREGSRPPPGVALLDEAGNVVEQPTLRLREVPGIVGSATMRAGRAIGRGARAVASVAGGPGSTRFGATSALEPIEESLGPSAARVLRQVSDLSQVPIRDPATGLLRKSAITLRPDQVTDSQLASSLASMVADHPVFLAATVRERNNVRGLVDAFLPLRQPASREQVGLGMRNAVRKIIDHHVDTLATGPKATMEEIHRRLGRNRIFRFDNVLQRIDDLINEEFGVAAASGTRALRSALLRTRRSITRRVGDDVDRTVNVNSRQFMAEMSAFGSKVKREALGETNSGQASRVSAIIYEAMTRDFQDAINRAERLGPRIGPQAELGLQLLGNARDWHRQQINQLREFKRGILSHTVGKLQPEPGRGMRLTLERAPEEIVKRAERLGPTQLRDLFAVLSEADPTVAGRLRSTMLDRAFQGVLEETPEGPINLRRLVRAVGDNEEQLKVMLGTERAQGLKNVQEVAIRLLRAPAGLQQQFLQQARGIGLMKMMAFSANAHIARAMGSRAVFINRKKLARILTEPDQTKGFLRALRFGNKRAAAARAFGRVLAEVETDGLRDDTGREAREVERIRRQIASDQVRDEAFRGQPAQ